LAKWLERLESMIGGGPGGPKRVRTLRWLLLIGCLGIGLLVINSFIGLKQVEPAADPAPQTAADAAAFAGRNPPADTAFEMIEQPMEQRLKEILEKIVGVGTVDVLVTVDSTEEIVVEHNEKESSQSTEESDRSGGRRHITSVTRDGQVVLYQVSGDQSPVVTKRLKPRIRGILIVAKGAEIPAVRSLIMDAVQRGFSVASNRISVVPRKQP
jgi:stage III sporulation protein AG